MFIEPCCVLCLYVMFVLLCVAQSPDVMSIFCFEVPAVTLHGVTAWLFTTYISYSLWVAQKDAPLNERSFPQPSMRQSIWCVRNATGPFTTFAMTANADDKSEHIPAIFEAFLPCAYFSRKEMKTFFVPVASHESVWWSGGYTPLILISVVDGGSWPASRPGRFTPWYQLNTRLGGPYIS